MIRTFSVLSVLIFLFIFLLHAMVFFLIKDHGLMMDEHYHYAQIQRFLHGDFRLNVDLPMAPGYHAAVAGLARLVGVAAIPYYLAVPLIRGVSWILSLTGVVFFFLSARVVHRQTAARRTLLFAVFPLFLPFFPLLYTDLFSLSIVLAAVWLFLKKKYGWSSVVTMLSIGIRQNNIIWCAFFILWWYVREEGYHFSWRKVWHHLIRSLVYVPPVITFLVVVWWFGGVASGAVSQQFVKATITVPENLFLLLFLYVPFFLPLVMYQYKQIGRLIKTIGWYWLVAPIAYLAFHLTFVIQHPHNLGAFFIHNAILEYFMGPWQHTLLFFLCMVLALLSLGVTRLHERSMYVLYPFTVLFLLPLVLVEQRYTFVPFALFLLFRREEKPWKEYLLVGWLLAVSCLIFSGIYQWKLFW